MKTPTYRALGIVWSVAAVASFFLYVNSGDPVALVRCGIFLMAGVLYLWANKRKKDREKKK